MLSALIVDADPAARARTGRLLQLAGWQVHEAPGLPEALSRISHPSWVDGPDLVVADVATPDADGLTLLRRLRMHGSRACFLAVSEQPTVEVRAAATAAGALACLAKPVDRRVLSNFLRNRATGPIAQENATADDSEIQIHDNRIHDIEDLHDADVDAVLMDRLQEMYVTALPARLSAIRGGASRGDAPAVASAAHALAGTSGQLGHPEVASVCRAIAADARRGIFAHNRIVELHELAEA